MGAMLGDDVIYADAGELAFKPREQWHTFWNAGDEPCRILEIIAPGGFEHFFAEMGDTPEGQMPDFEGEQALCDRLRPRERAAALRRARPHAPDARGAGTGAVASRRLGAGPTRRDRLGMEVSAGARLGGLPSPSGGGCGDARRARPRPRDGRGGRDPDAAPSGRSRRRSCPARSSSIVRSSAVRLNGSAITSPLASEIAASSEPSTSMPSTGPSRRPCARSRSASRATRRGRPRSGPCGGSSSVVWSVVVVVLICVTSLLVRIRYCERRSDPAS